MADDNVMGSEIYTTQVSDMPTKGTQKLLNIFFIVDISGSMKIEGRIEAVNEAFTQMVPALRKVQLDCMSEFELRIAIMTFEQDARWIVPPTPILEYSHEEIECSQWVTFFSSAFKTLGEKLTRKEYMAHTGKIAQPYIMFMTDGEPTEQDNYEPELDKLLENAWFTKSQRFAVLIGKDAINSSSAREAVSRFVSNTTEGIIDAVDAAAIAAEIQAKTIHTVVNMTQHHVTGDTKKSQEDNTHNENGGIFDDDGGAIDDGGWGTNEIDWDNLNDGVFI